MSLQINGRRPGPLAGLMKPWLGWLIASVRLAGWAPLTVFLAHVTASRILGTYLVFPSLDVPMHLLGGAAIAYFFRSSLCARESRPIVGALTETAATLFSFTATGLAAVFWEFAEWLSDRYLGTHAQLGLDDTLLDMLLGIAGGLALVVALAARSTRASARG